MFGKKRSVVMTVVNNADLETHEEHQESKDSNLGAHAYILMNNAVAGAAILIGVYFASDTLRHCIIHTVAVKVQPEVLVDSAKK